MRIVQTFLLFISLLLSACSFQSAEEEAGLIAGHKSTENALTFSGPSNGIYTEGQVLTFKVSHPFALTVTGTPRIGIDINGNAVYAEYVSGTGTKTLTFTYTVLAAQQDLDGIEVATSVDLNGGSITFTANATVTNASLTLPGSTLTGVKVDSVAPTVDTVSSPFPKTYLLNNIINIVVSFDSTVFVTGTPQLQLDIDGTTRNASYVSGSGTSNLTFRYTVVATDVDTDGITLVSPLVLNSGTIKDEGGNASALTFVAPDTSLVLVNGDAPYVVSHVMPSDGTYGPGENISMNLTFTEAVNVTGTPRISIDVDGTTKYMSYNSGSGTNTLIFSYTLVPGDIDADGITIQNTIDLNGGTIRDTTTTAAVLSLPPPLTPGIIFDAIEPEVETITLPTDGTYVESEILYFTLNFNTQITVTGIPRIGLVLASHDPSLVYAEYYSGSGTSSIIFKYTVESTQEDNDGIAIDPTIDLNSGMIRDGYGTSASLDLTAAIALIDSSNINVDTVGPEVTLVTPASSILHGIGSNLDFQLTFHEAVAVSNTPRIAITLTSGTVYANYLSGNNTTILTFRYTVSTNDEDTDGLTMVSPIDLNTSGTLRDAAGNDATLTFTVPDTSGVQIDGIVPTISITSSPTINSSNYTNYVVSGNCSENGQVVTVDVGGVQATPTCSGGTFTTSAMDLTAVSDNPTLAVTADHDDSAGNSATQASTTVIKDTAGPAVAITTPADNSYINSSTNSATFAVSGTCDENGQTVNIQIDSVDATSQVGFVCDGTNFSGTIDTTGLLAGARSFTAQLTDANSNSSTSTANSVTKDIVAPTISNMTITNGNYVAGNTINSTVTFSEQVTIATANPSVALTVDATARALTGSQGTNTSFTFSYTVVANEYDYDGVTVGASLSLNGASITDDAGNTLTDTSLTTPNASNVKVVASGMTVWLDASDATTLFSDNGCTTPVSVSSDPVGCWSDNSGNGNNATQATLAYQPLYTTGALNTQSGLTFDGSNDFFDDANNINAKTIYIVFKSYNTTGDNQLWGNYFDGNHISLLGATGGFSMNGNGATAASQGSVYVFGGSSDLNTLDSVGSLWSINTGHLIKVVYDDNAITQSRQTIGILDPTSIGFDQFDGEIYEIIVFSGTLDATANTAIESYLSTKYGL